MTELTELSIPLPPDPLANLSTEQRYVAERIINCRTPKVFFVTGEAGTGKSYVLNAVRRARACCVCATTARAALNIGGTTIDRVFNMNREDYSVRNYNSLCKTMEEIPDLIQIDEASMSGRRMSDLIQDIACSFNKTLVLYGDLAQASPVKDDWGTRSSLFQDAEVLRLTECHRQNDGEYYKALTKLRRGEVTDDVRDLFKSRVVGYKPLDEEYDKHVRMFATNKQAAEYNMLRFEGLQNGSPEARFMCEFVDTRDAYLKNKYPHYDSVITSAYEGTRLAHDEWMKIGARVLFTVNDKNGSFVNGDTGEVLDLIIAGNKKLSDVKDGRQIKQSDILTVTIKRDRGNVTLEVPRQSQEFKDPRGRPNYAMVGFPFRLGWGLTIHKSQGMTLDKAYVDVPSILAMPGESRHGLAYVALSRTRELSGLALTDWNDDAVYCSKEVLDYL